MPHLLQIFWDASPEIARIGPLSLRWYGILFALGFLIGFFLVQWMFRIERKPEEDLDRLLIYTIVSTIVGARLGHVLFYDPAYYLSNPLQILYVWHGGLASHGAAIGLLTGLYIYTRSRPEQPYLWLLDRLVVPVALAGSLIRVGNLFNSEILGTPSDLPWAFIFARVDGIARHPAQLYEALAYLIIFVVLLFVYRRYRQATPRGLLLGLMLLMTFTARFFIEFVKQEQEAFEAIAGLHMGQWLSLPMIIAGIILLLRARKKPEATEVVARS
jgi:phosphatidylglycerol---prolipoprotein diacylglyceryl transferase